MTDYLALTAPEATIRGALLTATAVLLGLAVQTVLALRTLRQRERADRREAHWQRMQWAIDLTLRGDDDVEHLEMGLTVLEALAADRTSPLAFADLAVLQVAMRAGDARLSAQLEALAPRPAGQDSGRP